MPIARLTARGVAVHEILVDAVLHPRVGFGVPKSRSLFVSFSVKSSSSSRSV